MSETETHTSTWDYTIGFTITIGASFSGEPRPVCCVVFMEATFKLDTAIKSEWKWGGSNSFSKSWKASFPAKAGPGETVSAISTVIRGQLEVPYTKDTNGGHHARYVAWSVHLGPPSHGIHRRQEVMAVASDSAPELFL
ncbi:hemolytic lectin LSLa [Fomitopsis schrenkii]|uniref:Hemolytic lectin LSLa n=1 Tax=Fomitopsis schrenkii TaxID=2126942 RepID=S8EI85_FOMSC|nr:hemolytic lectin LSLa [Fomitopsis schrenkii]